MTLPKITGFFFREVPIEHFRRVWIADKDPHSSGQLTRPIWGLHILFKGACSSVVERSPRERKVPSSSLCRGSGDVVGKHLQP